MVFFVLISILLSCSSSSTALSISLPNRIYETCTREQSTVGGKEPFYWCPKSSDANATDALPDGASMGKCSAAFYPPDNGCDDHYDPVGDYCVRVSAFPKDQGR